MKGIPCFDYREIGPKNENTIGYQFVSGDTEKPIEIPFSAKVSLGDIDPLTGEQITDVTFFHESRIIHNEQVYQNKKARCVPLTDREKAMRRKFRKRLAEDFEQKYGYPPTKKMLNDLMAQKCPRTYRMEIDAQKFDDGDTKSDRMTIFADRNTENILRKIENGGLSLLESFAETLDDREREMFDLLQMKSDGDNMYGMINSLAEKWGIEQYKVTRMKLRIGKKLLKYMKEED